MPVGGDRQLGAANEQIAAQATRDALTGADNRRAFDTRLSQEVARAGRYNHRFSLLLIDIDEFNALTNSHGERTANAVLRTLAYVIESQIRESDWMARFEDDAFAVFFPETDPQTAVHAAERIREAVTGARIPAANAAIGFTVSIGVAAYPECGPSARGLLDSADHALSMAKQDGGNQVCLYQSPAG